MLASDAGLKKLGTWAAAGEFVDKDINLADVQELIKVRTLDAEFAERLDPYVREKYLELWNAVVSASDGEKPDSERTPD